MTEDLEGGSSSLVKRIINFSQHIRQHFFKEVRKSNEENRPLYLLCLYSGMCVCVCVCACVVLRALKPEEGKRT